MEALKDAHNDLVIASGLAVLATSLRVKIDTTQISMFCRKACVRAKNGITITFPSRVKMIEFV